MLVLLPFKCYCVKKTVKDCSISELVANALNWPTCMKLITVVFSQIEGLTLQKFGPKCQVKDTIIFKNYSKWGVWQIKIKNL